MRIMAFDLSTKIIGVVAAEVDVTVSGEKIVRKVTSVPIVPPTFDVTTLGFKKTKKRVHTKNGKSISSYVYKDGRDGDIVSETEKKTRDRLVRGQKDIFVLEEIGRQIEEKINVVQPNLILVEKNCIFNGVLTTVLLAKVMGVLLGVAGAKHIPVEEYAVNEVRSVFNIPRMLKEFSEGKTETELKAIPDVTKRALRAKMEDIYDIKFLTDDESDACVVFHYWLKS